eukprot:6357586-Prymnesium_polylepis.1
MMLAEADWRVVERTLARRGGEQALARTRSWPCTAPDATAVRASPVALRCVLCGVRNVWSDRETP